MEQSHTFESVRVEVVNINLASEAKPKVMGVEFAAEQEFLNDAETPYFVTLTKIPVESSGPDIKTPQNPVRILETIGGGLQRLANMEAAIPQAIAEEPSDFLRALAESNASSLNMASIESGVLPTYGDFGSIIVVTVQGKLGPAAINQKNNTFSWPTEPRVEIFNPQDIRRPQTWERRATTLDETPFAAADMSISVDDETAKFPDRAVSVIYDAKTDTTFIGISRGIEFDRLDVKKTVDDRTQHPGKKAYDRRVSENMLARLQAEDIVDAEGYYERIEKGKLVRRKFDVQNPHEYINPDFNRAWQIAEMEVVLFNSVKSVRRRANLMQNAFTYGIQPDFSRLVDTAA